MAAGYTLFAIHATRTEIRFEQRGGKMEKRKSFIVVPLLMAHQDWWRDNLGERRMNKDTKGNHPEPSEDSLYKVKSVAHWD